jgi:hypothetical protein
MGLGIPGIPTGWDGWNGMGWMPAGRDGMVTPPDQESRHSGLLSVDFGCMKAAGRPGPPTCLTDCHAPNNCKYIFVHINES